VFGGDTATIKSIQQSQIKHGRWRSEMQIDADDSKMEDGSQSSSIPRLIKGARVQLTDRQDGHRIPWKGMMTEEMVIEFPGRE
jgi:hypothetical protein